MPGLTAFEKIWRRHCVAALGADMGLILIDRVMLHERTGAVALRSLEKAGRAVRYPAQVFATMDHIIDTLPGRSDQTAVPSGTSFIVQTRESVTAAGITLFDIGDPRQGISHVISPEQGLILPGLTLVCPDSHTCTQGALGGLAWGIGSTEAEHALATGTLRVTKPGTMRITVSGRLAMGVSAKDLALHIIRKIGTAGAKGYIVEFAGEAVQALDIESRLTLCNMATEMAAFTAIISADEKTFSYLRGRPYAPDGDDWTKAVAEWRACATDPDAEFDVEHAIEAGAVSPTITWGTSPQQAVGIDGRVPDHADIADLNTRDGYDRALAYMNLKAGQSLVGTPIKGVFLGSCTNSRLNDLREAAALLKGRKIAPGVRAICVPGSTKVKRDAEAEGLDRIFVEAGFEWRESGCSMCFFAGGESFGFEERVVSSTNRNFESRQGPRVRTHIASPQTVVASAIAGAIADPRMLEAR